MLRKQPGKIAFRIVPTSPVVRAVGRARIMRWVVRLIMPAMMLAAPALLAILTSCSAAEGEALFFGREPLAAHIDSDPAPLPASVTRCVNCHEQGNAPLAGGVAPRLDQRSMLSAYARRGGPPSHFNKDRFCSMLRDGVDPASVVISADMPRYEIDERDCKALWLYVLSR